MLIWLQRRLAALCLGSIYSFCILLVSLAPMVALASTGAAIPNAIADASAPRVVVEARDQREFDLWVAPAFIDPLYRPVANGFAEWIRLRARAAGLSVLSGRSLRRDLAIEQQDQASDSRFAADVTAALLARAREKGARHALLIDMRLRRAKIEVDFRLYELPSGSLRGGGLAVASPKLIAYESEEALSLIDERLGMALDLVAPGDLRALDLDALSAATRALAELDAGRLSVAYEMLREQSNLLAAALRKRARVLAARSTTTAAERARMSLQLGEGGKAWGHLSEAAAEAYRESEGSHETLIAAGDVQLALGSIKNSRAYYERALEVAPQSARATMGLAKVLLAEKKPEQARAGFVRAAALAPNWSEPFELGELYNEQGDPSRAAPLLERAHEQAPMNSRVGVSLARVYRNRKGPGDSVRALELYRGANARHELDSGSLREMAELQRESGDLSGARETLEQAIALRSLDLEVQRDLVAVLDLSGDTEAANDWAKSFNSHGLEEFTVRDSPPTPASEASEWEPQFKEIDALIQSFTRDDDSVVKVALVGVREPMSRLEFVRDWFTPRTSNRHAIREAILDSIASTYHLTALEELGENFQREVESLFLFEDPKSRNVETISDLNIAYDSDAVFFARLLRMPGNPNAAAGSCTALPHFELELRRAAGQQTSQIQILANRACIEGGVAGKFGSWNRKAGLPYGVLFVVLFFPIVRGWGRLDVEFSLPDNATAQFAVSLTRRPQKAVEIKKTNKGAANSQFRNRLRQVGIRERRLEGRHMSFRWVPARKGPYCLTVRGPLMDLVTNCLVGECAEERIVTIERGKLKKIHFDMRVHEAAVTIEVKRAGQPAADARFAKRGVPRSTRFCSQGKGLLYLGKGEHIIVVGLADCVLEKTIVIDKMSPSTAVFDLDAGLLFEGCPDAVGPYLDGDYVTASDALRSAGLDTAADCVAERRLSVRAVALPEAQSVSHTGLDEEIPAAIPQSSEAEFAADGARLEEQGEYAAAAEAYRSSGNIVEAARCFESCRQLAEILNQRGELDLAVAKYDEGLRLSGTTDAPLEMLSRYAELLVKVDRAADALEVYDGIRQRDLHFDGIATKIEGVRKKLSRVAATGSGPQDAPTALAHGRVAEVQSRYEIIEELGRGGMGIVYRAMDKHLQRVVALKVLSEQMRENDLALELFLREARSAAALNHQNIVTVFDAGQEEAMDFISMECLEGSGLDQILKKRGSLSNSLVASIGLQVATGLHYAQGCKIIHRDIKPSNLFITTDRIVKILDFGLAKMVEEVRRASTIIGGTPNYMAPEQASGGRTDHRTDLYALGGTLFHLATGVVPYESGDVTYQHAHAPVPDPRERSLEVSASLAGLIMKLMAKSPDDRCQSAREVAAALQKVLKE